MWLWCSQSTQLLQKISSLIQNLLSVNSFHCQLVFYLSTNAAFCECRRLLTFSIVVLIGQNNQASCRDTIPNPHQHPATQHTNSLLKTTNESSYQRGSCSTNISASSGWRSTHKPCANAISSSSEG